MKDDYVHPRKTPLGLTPGMELRDWFAGQAVIGLLSNPKHDDDDNEYIALMAYGVANYLMEEREQN
jgi:hypothetical protein